MSLLQDQVELGHFSYSSGDRTLRFVNNSFEGGIYKVYRMLMKDIAWMRKWEMG
jgi:hypothetical protein